MSNFGLPEYDPHREWIRNARTRNMNWDLVEYAGQGNNDRLAVFLQQQTMLNFWKSINCNEWKALVSLQKEAEEQTGSVLPWNTLHVSLNHEYVKIN